MGNTSITNRISAYQRKFVGISTVRWCSKRAALGSTAPVWEFELPVLRDNVTFAPAEPTINNSKIYGKTEPWTTTAEPGDVDIDVLIAATDDILLSWAFTVPATAPVSFDETADTSATGAAGTWSFTGVDMDLKVIEGMLMIISEDGKTSLIIKNFHGYANLVTDNISNQPIGIKLKGTFTPPVSGDLDGDVVFGDFTETTP